MTSPRPRCRQCDRALLAQFAQDFIRTESFVEPYDDRLNGDIRTIRRRGKLLGYGYGATGLFCSLTCGHAFAVKAIREKTDERP